MKERDEPEARRKPLACWFCNHRFTAWHVLRDGILRSRRPKQGGPYRIYICPQCNKENLCEETTGGRWFASPNCRLTFLDYVFSHFIEGGTSTAETLLAAIAWFRENEERRRYFFEADGDRRYRSENWLARLWPVAGAPEPAAGRKPPPRKERKRVRSAGAGLVGPCEILGVPPDAGAAEIQAAFRRLAVQYHPDKVSHLGEEFERMAHKKFLQLKEAYESLLERARAPDG